MKQKDPQLYNLQLKGFYVANLNVAGDSEHGL